MSLLIFDDRNSTISFSIQPAWIQGGTSPDFDGTSTWATNPGASFTFQFTGLYILHASPPKIDYNFFSVSRRERLRFWAHTIRIWFADCIYSIDGGDAQLVTAVPPVGVEFIFQQLLFNRSGLAGDVQHTLSVTTVMVTNAIYYVDYIEVQAAPSVTKTLASGNSITTSTTKWTDIPWINTSAIQVSSTSEAFNLNTASPKLVDSTHPTSITPNPCGGSRWHHFSAAHRGLRIISAVASTSFYVFRIDSCAFSDG